MHFLRNFKFARSFSGAVAGAPITLELHPLYRQSTDSERVSEGRRDNLEVVNALGVWLLMNAIERRNPFSFQISGHAFIGREHEFLDDAVRDVAFGAADALHQSDFVKLDDRLLQIEIN